MCIGFVRLLKYTAVGITEKRWTTASSSTAELCPSRSLCIYPVYLSVDLEGKRRIGQIMLPSSCLSVDKRSR